LADREDTSGGGDPAIAHDHATVVQRRFGMKKREQQFGRKGCIHDHSRLFVNLD